MKLAEILIKPILSEKANPMQEKRRQLAFRLARKANKLEIKKAVEEFLWCKCCRCKDTGCSWQKQKPLYKSRCYFRP